MTLAPLGTRRENLRIADCGTALTGETHPQKQTEQELNVLDGPPREIHPHLDVIPG